MGRVMGCALCIMYFGVGPSAVGQELIDRSRACLAQLDGQLTLAGLKQPVEILRDRWGVAHIYAKNQDDLFFAQGVVAAQDRLFQIDLWRRRAVGEMAALLGPDALAGDRFARLVKYRGDMQAEWSSYSPDAQAIVTAFTNGINAYIDHLGERLPIEYQILGIHPTKWRPEDCLGRMSGVIMVRNFRQEIPRAELVAAVGAMQARRIAPVDPAVAWKPAMGLDLEGVDRSILDGYETATKSYRFATSAEGSNNWTVDSSLSASGKPLLASDPHRSVELPSLRYLVHLHAPGWNVIGGGEPGLPGVAIGHNDRIAWGFTIVGTDQSDVYVEVTHPEDPTRYRVGGDWQPMRIVHEKVDVKGRGTVDLELRFTRHGPVIHEDRPRHRAYALRWVGAQPGTAAYLGSLAVGRANNWQEYKAAMQSWKMPSENMVYADVEGNIGWVAAALTPIRQGWHGLLPVPGADGKYEWQGFLSVKQLPQEFNPARHYIATANHNILSANDSHDIGFEFLPPFRFEQVKRRLTAQQKFDIPDFCSMQHDNRSIPAEALIRVIESVELDPSLARYESLLTQWDGVLSRDSQAGPLYAIWLDKLLKEFFRPHVPSPQLDFVASQRALPMVLAAVERPTVEWFGDPPALGRDKLVRSTFADAVAELSESLGEDPGDWSWGKLHHARFEHPLGSLGALYSDTFDRGPIPQAGDAYTPNATRHDRHFRQQSGATYRHVLDLADWDRGMATSAPGQSGQPGSPHYADLLELWRKDQYFPLAFSRDKVEDVTQHRLNLVP